MTARSPRRGLMLVISSPSGAGKTSLGRRLTREHPDLVLSVSCTTRQPRSGELDGREYHFITRERFDEMVAQDAFLEHALVHEHCYGTPKADVMRLIEAGRDVLFDIDWQGARSIAAQAPADVVRVFVLPPSMGELRRRLHARAQDAEDVIARRLVRARDEIGKWADYDYVILNDDFEAAYAALLQVYQAERLKRDRNLWLGPFVQDLLDEGD